MNKLIELLRAETDFINSELEKATLEGRSTPQEISERRENIIQNFFRKYYPFPFQITKGNIIDSFGNESNSIDCIILNPAHPHTISTTNNKHSVILADGADFAIEIKPNLCNKNELFRALEQVCSVKQLRRKSFNSSCDITNNCGYTQKFAYTIPCILFTTRIPAKIDKFFEDIANYYKENKLKRIYQFDAIVVNGEKIIVNTGTFINTKQEKRLYCVNTEKDTLAFLLLLMSQFPLAQVRVSEDVLKAYLKELFCVYSSGDWNEKAEEVLSSIETEHWERKE